MPKLTLVYFIMVPINANLRQDALLKTSINIPRIVSIALPFFALDSKTATLSSIGISCYRCYTLWNKPTDDATTSGNKWVDSTLFASYVAFGYLFPAQGRIPIFWVAA